MSIPTIATNHVGQTLRQSAHYFDVKTIEGTVALRQFIAQALSYHPWWVKVLYGIRSVFVRLLGMRQPQMKSPHMAPEDVSFAAGSRQFFFTVESGQEDSYWLAYASEKHLTARLLVEVQPLGEAGNRFTLTTFVHYNHWTGPLYFNVIRPFHHMVVKAMMNAGVKDQKVADHA
jgi:Protein of unknown function (DUF2867)